MKIKQWSELQSELNQLFLEIEELRGYLHRMVEETGHFNDPLILRLSVIIDQKVNHYMLLQQKYKNNSVQSVHYDRRGIQSMIPINN